jgi:site-specific DNA recombinase
MTKLLPVGLYVRLSEVRPGDEPIALETQEADARELAHRRGWHVAEVYRDAGRSAWADSRERPAFDRMVGDLEEGRIRGVIAWKQDRLGRRVVEVADLLDRCRRLGAVVATVADGLDTTTSSGRMVAQVLAAAAELESSNTSVRVRRSIAARAERGDAHGGPRPFGYRRRGGTLVVDAEEAETIRECASRVLAGESVGALVRSLRERGIRTSTGRDWTRRSLVNSLTAARIAGLRSHHGHEVTGSWDPIVSRDQLVALRVRLAPTAIRRATARSYYLSGGLLRCGRCGSGLKGRSWTPREGRGRRAQYACSGSMDHNGCGGVAIAAEPIDRFVAQIVIARLASPELRARLEASEDDAATDDLFRLLSKLDVAADDLASAFGAGELDRRGYRVARERNVLERRLIERDLRGRVDHRGSVLRGLPSTEAGLLRWWADASVTKRHALASLVIEEVIVRQAVRGRKQFDPERLDVTVRL